jgi:peptidoglycan/LPS O-acetylase OafA/YrhL
MTTSTPEPPDTGPIRYDGLDLFRPLSILGVVLVHFPRVFDLGSDRAFGVMMRLRDCALPIIILTSFFVVTRSLLANPGRTFAQFASNRFMRLSVPCAVWSVAYWFSWEIAEPLWRGRSASWPPPSIILSGYRHLWFLQFLFLGSVVAYPIVRTIGRRVRVWRGAAGAWAAACAAAAFTYWAWGRSFLTACAATALGEQTDVNLRVAIGQAIAYAKYPLLGVAAALVAPTIDGLYRHPTFRIVSTIVAAAACVVHVAALAPTVTRVFYSVTVFVALLRPWPTGLMDWMRPLARLSYPIYVLHPFLAMVVVALSGPWLATPSIAGLAAGSLATFGLSAAAASLLRMLPAAEWLLPVVAVKHGRTRAVLR